MLPHPLPDPQAPLGSLARGEAFRFILSPAWGQDEGFWGRQPLRQKFMFTARRPPLRKCNLCVFTGCEHHIGNRVLGRTYGRILDLSFGGRTENGHKVVFEFVSGADFTCLLHHVPSLTRLKGSRGQVWSKSGRKLKLKLRFVFPNLSPTQCMCRSKRFPSGP